MIFKTEIMNQTFIELKKSLLLIIVMVKSTFIFSQVDSTEEVLTFDVIEDLIISDSNYILNFSYNEFLDKTTGKFDSATAYNMLPWKIRNIYNSLKNKKDIIYEIEEINLYKNKSKPKYLQGFKLLVGKNEIESKMYNYTNDEFYGKKSYMRDIYGETIELTPIEHVMKLKKTSTEEYLKFMPFGPLGFFRVLPKKETIILNNQKYLCVIAEGLDFLLVGDKWRYWMVENIPGLIVKAIKETGEARYIWLFKEIR
jgi:hypothetical protein